MLRISALNDSSSSEDSQASNVVKEATKEAKEAEAYSLYTKALELLRHGKTDKAEAVFRDLIDHDFLQEAADLLEEKGGKAIHPGLQLLYSIYKNLAAMATKKHDYTAAVDWYIEAVKIDNSEVTVLYKLGVTALKIEDFQLAKGAFEEGLECNPRHWPCLDSIITVMFALNNYSECLYFIAKAFEMEIYYDKGHAIRNKIYQDQPCLKSDTEEFFMYCDKELSDVKVDPLDAKKFVDEALQMRRRRQELSKPPDPIRLQFPEQLKEYSWRCVGETLIKLYDKAVNSEPIISLGLKVDVPSYDGISSQKDLTLDKEPTKEQNSWDAADKKRDVVMEVISKEGDVAMETDGKEGPTAMEVDDDKEVLEKTEPLDEKPVVEDEKDVKVLGSEPGSHNENKKPALPVDDTNEMEITNDGQKTSEVVAKEPDIVVNNDESSGSLLEAVSVAHSMLDSLSPVKMPTLTQNSSSLMKTEQEMGFMRNAPDLSEKSDFFAPKNEKEKTFGDIKHAPDIISDSASSSLQKSSSFGFSVSNIQIDSCTPDLDVKLALTEPSLDSALPSVDSNMLNRHSDDVVKDATKHPTLASGVNTPSDQTSNIVPSSKQTKPSLPTSEIVIDLTDLTSDSESQTDESPPNPRAPVTSHAGNQPVHTSSPMANHKPEDLSSDLLSPVHSLKPVITSRNEAGNAAVAMTTQGSNPLVNQGFHNNDHEYSKASSTSVSVPIVTSPPGQCNMLTSESVPVNQPLLRNIESNNVDSSPGVGGADSNDKNAASKRLQKKRKLSIETEELMMYGKRRSSRVKNTAGKKKEEEPVKFKDLLQAFLPSNLKHVQTDDSGMMDSSKEDSVIVEKSMQGGLTEENGPIMPAYKVWEETDDVKSFLKDQHCKNYGLVDIMNKFLHVIARNWKLKWSDDLGQVFIGVFNCVRQHVYMPNVLDTYDGADIFQEVASICLVLSELQVDRWLCDRTTESGLQSVSPMIKSTHVLLEENIPAYFEEDMMFLTILCGQSDRLADHWVDHCVRVYWMKSKYAILLGKIEEAIYCYERLREYLEYMKTENDTNEVVIPNCKMENIVTLELVISQQDMLQKVHCVEETQRLYEKGEFERVVEILLQTFSQPPHKSKVMKVESSERRSQLTLLQDAMFKTGNDQRSALWGEESLNEAYQEYKVAGDKEDKAAWLVTAIDILSGLQRVLDRDSGVVGSLPSVKLVRLSQNLIRMIDKNMSLPDTATEMVIDSVIPWALLYQLIKFEEDKNESLRLKDSNSGSEEVDDAISSSLMLLNVGHDYLGGRSWCTKSDGSLLLFFMNVLNTKLEVESNNLEDYQQAFEQCVYCLFGHPNKKAKAKHLQDHNVTGISLQWEHAILVFDYFKPKAMPEFDGYKSETITTELEVLFKRIIPLVPEDNKSKILAVEEVHSYIDGTKDNPPALKEGMAIENPVLEEIYYLLGDYYLKNSEFMKAIKFYNLDLCVNPDRLDSWAGMALARMSQLESKLTSAEIKMDAPIYKKSIAALRCFKRATEIEDSNAKLWIEYGTLAYQLHAHASKQIRWKQWFAMEQEVVDIAVESKREMLQTAFHCFRRASDWNEEEWLHNYMLGKCLEKMGKPIKDVLQYYFQAYVNVHEEKAKYPKKIIYAYTTPHLSVEALELYYRIHVVILKCLMKETAASNTIDYKLLATSIAEAAFSPFVLRVEKGQEAKLDQESASSADESSCSEVNTPMKRSTQGSADHTYFRQKSNQDSLTAVSSCRLEENPLTDKDDGVTKSSVVVTTMELHAEPTSDKLVTLTTTTTEAPANPVGEMSGVIDAEHVTTAVDVVSQTDSSKQVGDERVVGSSPDNQQGQVDTDTVEDIVKSVINHIEDMVVAKVEMSVGKEEGTAELSRLSPLTSEMMDVGDDKVTLDGRNVMQQKDQTLGIDGDIFKGIQLTNLSSKKEEMLDSLLKLSGEDLHIELIDRCRKAFELCLQRFPTHYKSHYRLAQIYSKIAHFKDLEKAHNLMLAGSVKWQQLSYMPCPAMFGERKMSKFFQGIWKIPIDEIDRAGSFPSHLNRCIEQTLNILKEQSDCHALHQVHLQLNKQPEPGKKYLRDAEKKFYALMSHRYTLDAAEARIQDMKSITDTEQRHKFLLLFYKIWEHGVHKLNKQVERTNKLLAEAYRVVLRKLETLPHKMLLDQAVRYCKHLMSQKSKIDKDNRSSGVDTTPDGKPKSGLKLSSADETVTSVKSISLENIMKSQANLKTIISAVKNKPASEGQDKSSSKTSDELEKQTSDKSIKTGEAIVIDSSSDSSSDNSSDSENDNDMITKSTDVKQDSLPTTPTAPVLLGKIEKAPTVKIKMGLLQAAKRLKPTLSSGDDKKTDGEEDDEKMEDELDTSPMLEEEVPDLLSNADENEESDDDGDSSSSSSSDGSSASSSSGDSSSDDDDGDDEDNNDEKGNGDDDADDDKSVDLSDNDDDDDSDEKTNRKFDNKSNADNQLEAVYEPPNIQVVISSSNEEDDDESSDNSQEVDLASSGEDNEKDDEKDTDYKASEDDDVIMISDDEFKSKSRAILPSPPHTEKTKHEGVEILVEKVPDFIPFPDDI